MALFSAGAATLIVEKKGVSVVEYDGPNASMGESGGSLGSLEEFLADAWSQKWVAQKFGEDQLREANAEARRLLGT
jgi:hypothetical protein